MLNGLSERIAYLQAQHARGFAWYQLNIDEILQVFPFWNRRDIQRISTNLREKGVLIVASPPIESTPDFRFAFNEKVQQQLSKQVARQAAHPIPTASAHAPPAITPAQNAPIRPQGAYETHFLSKNFIAPNWQPDDITLGQLAQHTIPSHFAQQHIPEFVAYWRERGDKHHSWSSKFIQHVLRKWRDYETKQHKRDQESAMRNGWQPSIDALEILVGQAGIRREFVEDAIPEFILYWSERGETHSTWNTKFVQHVRIQWAKFTSAIEHNTDPRQIPAQWRPSEDVYDVLRLANIDIGFAQGLIPEFVLYWRDRGILHTSWNTKYLQHVKRMWAQRHDAQAQNAVGHRATRDIRLEEELNDRSWAN